MSCDRSEILFSSPNTRYDFIVTKIYREINILALFFFYWKVKILFLQFSVSTKVTEQLIFDGGVMHI